ncbi:hypothetical protein V2J09_022314 [Rumex salicifolius]
MASSCSRIVELIYILSIFSLVATGTCLTCSFRDIQLTQKATGSTVSGIPEYRVDIFNACGCSQSNIELDCNGFSLVEPTDPSVLKKIGSRCVVAGGGSFIPPFQEAFFTYAWAGEFPFKPVASSPRCT